MTDILTLDLNSGADEDLLVPFSRPQVNPDSFNNNNNKNNNISINKRQDRGFGRFFRRPSQQQNLNQNKNQQKENQKAEENLPLQTTTFAFPKARVEQAEIDDSFHFNDNEKQPQDDDDDDDSSDEDEDDDEEYETDDDNDDGDEQQKKGKSHRKQQKQKRNNALSKEQTVTQSLKRLDEWEPTDNPYYVPEEEDGGRRHWQPQGFGSISTRELEDSRPKGWSALLNRFRGPRNQEDNLQSMRVATEATKDEKSLAEQIAKAALVVLVPELYMDEEDGEDNLGMYRTICTTTDDEADASMMKKNLDRNPNDNNSTTDKTATSALQQEIKFLRSKVASLDKSFKSAQLEAASWKLRCEELKKELRQYRGQSDDDSSVDDTKQLEDNHNHDKEDDDGIEEEWADYNNVKEGNLLQMPTANEQEIMTTQDEEEDDGIDEEWTAQDNAKEGNLLQMPTANDQDLMITQEEEDDGIDEEWTAQNNTKEGNLLQMPTANEKEIMTTQKAEDIINIADTKNVVVTPTNKNLLDLGGDEKEIVMIDENTNTEESALIDLTPEDNNNTMIFDPLAPSSSNVTAAPPPPNASTPNIINNNQFGMQMNVDGN